MTESPVWAGGLKERPELHLWEDGGASGVSSAVQLGPDAALRTGRHTEEDGARLRPVLRLPGQVSLLDPLSASWWISGCY